MSDELHLLDRTAKSQSFRNKPGAYRLTHIPTGKVYVGSTKDLSGRESEHRYKLKKGRHTCPPLQELFNKDPNPKNYRFECALTEDREKAFRLEKEWIDERKDKGVLLNVGLEVESWCKGREMASETKEKLRLARTGFKDSENVRLAKARHLDSFRNGAKNHTARSIVVDGVEYDTITEASKVLGIEKSTLRLRGLNPNFPNVVLRDRGGSSEKAKE